MGLFNFFTSKLLSIISFELSLYKISVIKKVKILYLLSNAAVYSATKEAISHDAIETKEESSHQIAKLINMHMNYDCVICGGKVTTLHFVAAQSFCECGILLKNGKLIFVGILMKL